MNRFLKSNLCSCFVSGIKNQVRVMKLIVLLMLVGTHFSFAGYSQQVTLDMKKSNLREVLTNIRRQTGYGFAYPSELQAFFKPVTVKVSRVQLKAALDMIFSEQSVTYAIDGRNINLTCKKLTTLPRPPMLPLPIAHISQEIITGRVSDQQGQPLVGVTVRVIGTDRLTVTDQHGEYRIAASGNDRFSFSFVGYDSSIIAVEGRSIVSIQLKRSVAQLEEVQVNKGYYSQKKLLNTGNVTTVTAEQIAKQPVGDPLAALYGQVPGFQIKQSTGAPGQTFTMLIRGQNSIANGKDPLLIVDGIPYPVQSLSYAWTVGTESTTNSLNPADIAEISVLKDADATAIYGSRGANGVILITTKRGVAGRTTVDANVYHSIGKVGHRLDLMNTRQYLEMRREALKNDGRVPKASEYDLNGTWDTTRYTDWQKVFVGGTAKTTDAQLRISGGNERTRFIIGGGYRKETTVYPGDYFDERKSIQAGFDHNSKDDRLKLMFNTSYSAGHNKMPIKDFASMVNLWPNAPALYKEDGSLNWDFYAGTNPMSTTKQQDRNLTNNLLANFSLDYRLLGRLHFKTNLSFNKIDVTENQLSPRSSFNPSDPSWRENLMSKNNIASWNIEPQLNYSVKMGDGMLDALLGMTFQQKAAEMLVLDATGFDSDALLENLQAANTLSIWNYAQSIYRYNAIFSRIGYNWKERYILNLTGRIDGSSRFGPDKRFGSFGAIGAAWIFSNERLVKAAFPYMSLGKIRGSFGITGNDQFPDYEYLSVYNTYTYNYQDMGPGLIPLRHTNPNYSWETVKKLEIALELGFLANRINLEASFYRNRTGNQLVGYSLADFTGFSNVRANLPAVVENKGLELMLNTINIQSKDWQWRTSANITIPRSKLVKYPGIENSSYRSTYAVGKSLSTRNVYQFDGIDPQTGAYRISDLNHDGVIDYDHDVYFDDKLGTRFFGGISSQLSYKGISFSILANYSNAVGEVYYFSGLPGSFLYRNQPVAVLDRWRKPGDAGKSIARYTTDFAKNNYSLFKASDAMFGPINYFRIRNLELSWLVPSKWVSKMHLMSLRVYMQCQNPFIFSGYRGVDPELGSAVRVAPLRVFSWGLQVKL